MTLENKFKNWIKTAQSNLENNEDYYNDIEGIEAKFNLDNERPIEINFYTAGKVYGDSYRTSETYRFKKKKGRFEIVSCDGYSTDCMRSNITDIKHPYFSVQEKEIEIMFGKRNVGKTYIELDETTKFLLKKKELEITIIFEGC